MQSDIDINCRHILQFLLILLADNEGPDQPAQMRSLIRACVVLKLQTGPFRALRIKCFKVKVMSLGWVVIHFRYHFKHQPFRLLASEDSYYYEQILDKI